MNLLQRKIGHKRYLFEQAAAVYLITWHNIVNFPADRTTDNIRHLIAENAPLPLRYKAIEDRATIMFTNGMSFKILESHDEFMKDCTLGESHKAGELIRDLLVYISENFEKIDEHYKKQYSLLC